MTQRQQQSKPRPSSSDGSAPVEPDVAAQAGPLPSRHGRSGNTGAASQDDPGRAYDACLRLLAARARSRAELADRLIRREFSQGTVDTVLARLEREKLIDDADFAEQWVHFRHRDGGKAKRALAQELRHKGVADEVAAAALEQVSREDEAQRATELVRRKLSRKVVDPNMDREQRNKEMRRLVGMLARKGYSEGLAYRVVKEAWATAAHSG